MKKIINPMEILKISIQWFLLHFKTITVIGLSYLGIDKILEDMAFYSMDYGTYRGTLKEFFSTLLVDGFIYLAMMLLVYVIICVVSITLDKRPLTINAINLYLKRNTKAVVSAIGIIVVIGCITTISYYTLMNYLGIRSDLTIIVLVAYGAIGLLFAFIPHELMMNNATGFESVKNSIRKVKMYYGKIFTMPFILTLLYWIDISIVEWLTLEGSFPYRALMSSSGFVYLVINCIAITVFYHKIERDD